MAVLLLPALLAYTTTALLVRFVLLSPLVRERVLSEPAENRWHTTPTPSFGGVPMFMGILAAVSVSASLGDQMTWGLLLGAAVLLVLGVVDDRHEVKPRTKLLGQMVAAALVVAVAVDSLQFSLLAAGVAAAFIVLMANSVNLIDNMDGLAAGTSLASLVMILPVALMSGQTGLALVVAAVAGALAGFLVFNVTPARIFMGDSGSMWLGLILAATAGFADYGEGAIPWMAAATILALPLFDTMTVVYSRLRHGRPITHGGRDHLSHRLVKLGWSDGRAVLTLTLASAVFGAVGVSGTVLPLPVWIVTVVVAWTAATLLVIRLARVPVYKAYAADDVAPRGREVFE